MIMTCMQYRNKVKFADIKCIDCICKAESAKIICSVRRRNRQKNHYPLSKKFRFLYDKGLSNYTVHKKTECNDSLRVRFIPREAVKEISPSTSNPVEYVAPTVVFILSIIGGLYFLLRRRKKSRARKEKLRTRYLRKEQHSGIPTSSTACVESEYSTIDDTLRESHVRSLISSGKTIKYSETVGERLERHTLSSESRDYPNTTYFSLERIQERNHEIDRESNKEKRQLKDDKILSQSVDSRISQTDYSTIDQLEHLEIETLERDGLNDYFVLESVQKQNNQGIMKVCKDVMSSDDPVHKSNGWIEDEFSQNKDILIRTKGPMFQITKQSSEQQDTATYSHITSEHGDYNHLCHFKK